MFAVRAQGADALLVGKEAQVALGEVEERADSWVGLAVVVAEGAFIIASQLSDAVVDGERPVVREGFADLEFDRFVFPLWVFVSVGFAVGIELATERRTTTRLGLRLASAVS